MYIPIVAFVLPAHRLPSQVPSATARGDRLERGGETPFGPGFGGEVCADRPGDAVGDARDRVLLGRGERDEQTPVAFELERRDPLGVPLERAADRVGGHRQA